MSNDSSNKEKNSRAKERYKDNPVSGHNAHDLIMLARTRLMAGAPFFGQIAYGMQLIREDRCGTTAVDPKGRFYYNEKWVNHFTFEDAVFEVAHEVMHIVNRTFARMPQGANQSLWNKAADMVGDTMLVEDGLAPSSISKEMVPPETQKLVNELGCAIEPVYAHLLEESLKEKQNSSCAACNAESKQAQEASAGQDEIEKKDNAEINGDDTGNEDADDAQSECGSAAPGDEEEGHGLDHTCGNIRECCAGASSDFSQSDDPMLQQEWSEKVIAAKLHAESLGKMPGNLVGAIDNLTESTIRWQDILKSKAVATFGRSRYSFKRPNRRGAMINVRLPKCLPDGKSAVIACDTSGSMSDAMVRQSITEAATIYKQSGAAKIFLVLHDSMVYFAGEVTDADLTKLKMGRGGTSHRDVFKLLSGSPVTHMHTNEELRLPDDVDVELAVMFTDLGTDFPEDAPPYDVVWAVPEDGYPGPTAGVPFGKVVPMPVNK